MSGEFAYKKALAPEESNQTSFGAGYFVDVAVTNQLKAGELHVPPQASAGYDAGHPDADEVFYIRQGSVEIEFPESKERAAAQKGEYMFMPRGLPHVVHNTGDETAVVLYFCIMKN